MIQKKITCESILSTYVDEPDEYWSSDIMSFLYKIGFIHLNYEHYVDFGAFDEDEIGVRFCCTFRKDTTAWVNFASVGYTEIIESGKRMHYYTTYDSIKNIIPLFYEKIEENKK